MTECVNRVLVGDIITHIDGEDIRDLSMQDFIEKWQLNSHRPQSLAILRQDCMENARVTENSSSGSSSLDAITPCGSIIDGCQGEEKQKGIHEADECRQECHDGRNGQHERLSADNHANASEEVMNSPDISHDPQQGLPSAEKMLGITTPSHTTPVTMEGKSNIDPLYSMCTSADGLPEGWLKHDVTVYTAECKTYVCKTYWFSPKTRKRFQDKNEVRKFVAILEDVEDGDEDEAYDRFKEKYKPTQTPTPTIKKKSAGLSSAKAGKKTPRKFLKEEHAKGLPKGWRHRYYEQMAGVHKGKIYHVFVSPKEKKKFESKVVVNQFRKHLKKVNWDENKAYKMLRR